MASIIIDTLPVSSGTSISFDGNSTITGPRFKGVSKIPPGWHLFSYASTSNPSDSSSAHQPSITSSGITGIRHSLLRYFQRDEIVLRRWDPALEMIQPIFITSDSDSQPHSLNSEQFQSYLPMLAPYPIFNPSESSQADRESMSSTAVKNWKMATASLDSLGQKESRKLVSRIFGSDSRESGFDLYSGDAKMDSLSEIWSPSSSNLEPGRTSPTQRSRTKLDSQGRPFWGAARHDQDSDPSEGIKEQENSNEDGRPLGSLRFTDFDLKRSWPKDCNGQERTRWSVDKSWLLQDVVKRSGGPSYLLAELELAFLLFLSSHNPHCLDHFTSLISLFSQSVEIMGSASSFQIHPAFKSVLETHSTPNDEVETTQSTADSIQIRVAPSLQASFLKVLTSLFRLLPADFFSSQIDPETQKMERDLKRNLSFVRRSIGTALSFKASRDREADTGSSRPEDDASLLSQELASLIPAWRSLSHLCSSHFGWKLDSRLDEEVEVKEESRVIKASGRRDEEAEGEVDARMERGEGDQEEEDEEDLPVIVDLDEERAGWV